MVDRGTFTNIANDLSFVDEIVRSHAPLDSMTPLPMGWIPDMSSVICARGQDAYNHVGNRRFRVLVEAHVQIYDLASSKVEKSVVVMKIVDTVRECSGVGGFVRKDTITGRWFEVGDAIAREKAGQQFRSTIASTDPTKYQRKRRKPMKKNSVGKRQEEEEGRNEMTSSTQKNRSSSRLTASNRTTTTTTTSHQESTRTFIAKKTKAEDEQFSSSNGGTAKYSLGGEDRLVRSQYLLGVPFPRCSSARTPSNAYVRPDRQSCWERPNAVAEGKIEGVFGRRFLEQPAADVVFPSSWCRFTSTEDDDGSLNEKETLQDGGGGGGGGKSSQQEERMNTSCPSLLGFSNNDLRRQLMDGLQQRLHTSCPSFGAVPKDCALAAISTRSSSINKQPNPVEHQNNFLHREAQKGGILDATSTSTRHGRCEEVPWDRVFHDPPNFNIDDTFAFL